MKIENDPKIAQSEIQNKDHQAGRADNLHFNSPASVEPLVKHWEGFVFECQEISTLLIAEGVRREKLAGSTLAN